MLYLEPIMYATRQTFLADMEQIVNRGLIQQLDGSVRRGKNIF